MKDHTPRDPGELRRQAEEQARALEPAALAAQTPEENQRVLHELRVHQIELEMQNEELRRVQAQVEAGRARYFDLYDLAPVGYCTVSETGLILEANLTLASLLGTARRALVTQPLSHFIIREDQDTYYRHRKQLFGPQAPGSGQAGEPHECELRLVKPDGTRFWAHLTGTAAQAEEGAPVCRLTISDITERKQAEAAQREASARMAAIFEGARDAIFIADVATGVILEANVAAAHLVNRPVASLVGMHQSQLHPPEQAERYRQEFSRRAGQTAPSPTEGEAWTSDGRRVPVEINASTITLAGGPRALVGIFRDVSARKRAEDEQRETEQRFTKVFEYASIGMALVSPEGHWLRVNQAVCQMLGRSAAELLATTFQAITHPDDLDTDLTQVRQMLRGYISTYQMEKRYFHQSGAIVWALLSVSLVKDEQGAPRHFISQVVDITERKRAEAALLDRDEQLRSIASSIPGAIYQFVRRLDGRIEIPFMSEGARLLFDRPVAELQDPAHLFDDVHPDDVPGLWASIEASAKDLTPWSVEFRLVPKTAPLRWLRGVSNPHRMRDEGVSWYGVLLDITLQKRGDEQTRLLHTLALALAAASDLQQGLRLCLESALQGSGLDAGGFYLVAESSGALELWVPQGLSPDFVEAASRFEAPSDQARLIMAGSPVYARLEDMGLSLSEAERREGLRFTASIPLRYEGKVIGCMNVASHAVDDIPPATRQTLETIAATATQAIVRLRAEERLRASEALLNQTQRLSKVGGWEWDLIRQTMVWTAEMYRLHDLNAQDFAPGSDEHIRRSAACYGPEHQAAVLAAFRGCVERGEAFDLEVPFTSGKGRSMWVRTTAQAVWEGNRVVRVVGNLMDITELKRAEQALAEDQAHLAAVIRAAPTGVGLVANRVLLEVNERVLEMTGYTREELIGVNSRMLYPTEDDFLCVGREKYRQIAERGTGTVESRWRRKDGAIRDVLLSTTPLDPADLSKGVVFTTLDITARKQAEAALHLSLREKEALLKEVHHRVKNNLQVVTSLLRLEAGQSAEPGTKAVLREMQSRIRTMAVLHETLYRSGSFAALDLSGYLKQLTTQLLRAHHIEPGRVRLALALAPIQVEIDQAIPCGLIVNELVTNSLKHAFPPPGGGEVRVSLQQDAPGTVRLQVSDTGAGLPADFDLGRATTLGLQLVSDLTRQLHGTLEISPPGAGAGFTLTFASAPPRSAPARDC